MKRRNLRLYSVLSLLLCVSMVVGTTFAWFTDSVKIGINTIAAGNLDVELYHSNAAVSDERVDSSTKLFMDLQGDSILWEPGVVSYENLRIANEGDLALTYQLAINTANENYIVDPDTGALYGLSQILKVGFVSGGITATDRADVVASVEEGNWTTMNDFLHNGSLLPVHGQKEQTWGFVIYWEPGDNDNLWNLNNGKTLNEGDVLSIDLGVKLIATQEINESDSFNNGYDNNAKAEFFAGFQGGSAGAVVTADDQGVTTVEVAMRGGDVSAVIPTGVQVADGVNSLALSVIKKAASEANIQLSENEEMRPLDVHIEGVARGNTVPMLITLKHYLSTGINTGALKLYHVENGEPVAMTHVAVPANHNEFTYDPATGDVILALASFSEVAVVADTNNTWNGTAATAFAGGTGTEADPYLITNADQLAYFRNQVDGGNTFVGQYVVLNNSIELSNVNFDPIGYGYECDKYMTDGMTFNGTFDGNNKTIFGLHQNGWDLGEKYSYSMAGGGLFASVVDATIKNVKISGANIVMECVDMGILVGYSQGNCTYENIGIYNSKIANYQRATGGVVGEVSPRRNADGSLIATENTHTFKNINVGSDVVVGSLWGDFDAPCGGVIGARWDDNDSTKVVMENVTVACRMDVYNDITAAYQWHAYRRTGMLIGNTDTPAANGKTAQTATAEFLTCTNVKVYIGSWAKYHYCQFTNANSSYPWVRVEAGENCQAYSNPRWGVPDDVNGKKVVDGNHAHSEGDECGLERAFGQLYGGGQGVYGATKHKGVEVMTPLYTVTYMSGTEVNEMVYVTDDSTAYDLKSAGTNLQWIDNEGRPVTSIPAGNTKNVVVYLDDEEKFVAYFVDKDGVVIYSEEFTAGSSELKTPPAEPPKIDGYIGKWETYDLKNATGSIVIKPVYTIDPTFQEMATVTDLAKLFSSLSSGETVVMSQELQGSQGNASKENCCEVTTNTLDKEARLNLNGYTLEYNFMNPSGKSWNVFVINDGSRLVLTTGIADSGVLKIMVSNTKNGSTPSVFVLNPGSELVLEKGVVVEFYYPTDATVMMFQVNGSTWAPTPDKYPNLKLTTENGVKRLEVLETTVIECPKTTTAP